MTKPNTMMIDDVEYVRKDSVQKEATKLDGMPYKVIRTRSAGVFAGYLAEQNGDTVILKHARRLWYWSGAASLSQLAMEGVGNPDDCKFPCVVDEITLLGAIEVIGTTQKAKESIEAVSVWQN